MNEQTAARLHTLVVNRAVRLYGQAFWSQYRAAFNYATRYRHLGVTRIDPTDPVEIRQAVRLALMFPFVG